MNQYSKKMRARQNKQNLLIVGGVAVFFALAGVIGFLAKDINRTTHSGVEITGSENVCRGSGEDRECKYMVYTNYGTFENRDSLWHGKFNSADFHARFLQASRDGETCSLETVGFRNGVMSYFPNVINYACEKNSQ